MDHKHKHSHALHGKKRKLKLNLWKVFTVVLAVLLAVSLYFNFGGFSSEEKVATETMDFINDELLQGQTVAQLLTVEEKSGLYNLKLSLSGEEIDSYVTKDGSIFFPQAIMVKPLSVSTTEPSEPVSTATSEEITEFVSCLNEADFKIYGANWCGWTKKLVTMFGGFDAVTPIYTECTENQELCAQKDVQGYPTIIVAGEKFNGERTFESFASATGCVAPAGVVVEDTGDASCS